MNLSSSAAKKAGLSSEEKTISDLSDADLEEILKRLPPYERLIASEVCYRWHALRRQAWLDVIAIDLNPIPGKNIAVILRQCPNAQSAFAAKRSFDLNELACLSRASQLLTVRLYDCTLAVESESSVVNEGFTRIFSRNLQQTSWNELVLHDVQLMDKVLLPRASNLLHRWAFSAAYLPAALKRLQLSGLRVRNGVSHCADLFLNALERLQGLECLILHNTVAPFDVREVANHELIANTLFVNTSIYQKLGALKGLKELAIGPVYCNSLGRLIASLPKLEVLFLNDVNGYGISTDLAALITENAVLRILVLSGYFFLPFVNGPLDLPARKRYPRGFDSAPLPLLNVFVGKEASERIRFAKSASNAAVIHPINQPMPEFLVREDIAEIFEGVWVAQQIKKTAQFCGSLWNYAADTGRLRV